MTSNRKTGTIEYAARGSHRAGQARLYAELDALYFDDWDQRTFGPKPSLKQLTELAKRTVIADRRAAIVAERLDEDIEATLKIARAKASLFVPKRKGFNS
jgi:hypothetical protein